MKRKAIEKIEPAKTRKKGHIATVQTLDDIAIINVFDDKVLAVRYCINCKTGEHEYWTEKNGWKKGKLITDRKSTRLNSSHYQQSRMPSSA